MNPYVYNPACRCDWCHNNGDVPAPHPLNGHSFGYEEPHIPADSKPTSEALGAHDHGPIRGN